MISMKTLLHKYGNPLEWDSATKSALLLCLTLFAHSQYLLWAWYQLSVFAPEANQHYVNIAFLEPRLSFFGYVWAITLSLFLLVLSLRKRYPNSEWYEHLATQYYSGTLIYCSYVIGTLNIATGVVLAGAPVVGFILFNRRAVVLAFAVSIVGQIFISYMCAWGGWPYAPLVMNFQEAGGVLSHFWFETMYYFAAPHLIFLTVFAYHVLSRWRRREDEIRLLSLTDPLTQLSNRRSILSNLNHEHERSRRYGASLSLLLVDLDHFKKVNDSWGHYAGDQVLIEAGKALKCSVRQNDYVGRYGGEEFLVILPDTDTEGAYQLAERCRQHLEALEIKVATSKPLKVTGSMGLYCNETNRTITAEQMLHYADEALYKAKEGGRNRVVRSDERVKVVNIADVPTL